MPAMQRTDLQTNPAADYLRLTSCLGQTIPPRQSVEGEIGLRARWFSYFQSLINHQLGGVTWVLEEATVRQAPLWDEYEDLVGFAERTKRFHDVPRKDIDETFRVATLAGYLSRVEAPGKLVITKKMLQNLFETARVFHTCLVGSDVPDQWDISSGHWVPFNERVFAYVLDDVGETWVRFRSEINNHVRITRRTRGEGQTKQRYQLDYVGTRPGWWATINISAIYGPIEIWDCCHAIGSFGLNRHADLPAITRAISELCRDDVLTRHGDTIDLSPKFTAFRTSFIDAIVSHLPSLHQDTKRLASAP